MRLFARFELERMHRSDKGPKFGAPLFGVSSPFGDAGSGIQDLEGRASPHFRPKFAQIWPNPWVKSTSENKRNIQRARELK